MENFNGFEFEDVTNEGLVENHKWYEFYIRIKDEHWVIKHCFKNGSNWEDVDTSIHYYVKSELVEYDLEKFIEKYFDNDEDKFDEWILEMRDRYY